MARRVLFTIIPLLLAVSAFYGADPTPDVNLFGVLFLFFAFIVWFCWHDIQAGYSYLEDAGVPRYETSGLMFLRFAPMYLRELTAKKRRPT
jgi:apolipoprotein N-acyltransferase